VRTGPSGNSVISLPMTGQTTCYNWYGSVIPCTGTGQDGEIQAGVPWPNPRFTDKGNNTIKDNLTGLVWTKDGNAPGPVSCNVGSSMIWQDALDYIKCLNTKNYLGYNDWRLPNRKELRSLVNYGQSDSASWLNNNAQRFTNVQSSLYWSSSTYVEVTHDAWLVDIQQGFVDFFYKTFNYSSWNSYVWPVRAGQPFNLIVSKSGTGLGTVSSIPAGINCGSICSASFPSDTSVTLTATYDYGSRFAGWSGGECTGTGTCTVTMDTGKTITATFSTTAKGDLNNDGKVDLADAIIAIQVMSNIIPNQNVYKQADVNGDDKIGLSEAIYIIQKTAALR
jgi:hypothetical protein